MNGTTLARSESGPVLMCMFERLKPLGRNLRHEIRVYQLVMKHPRTPRLARLLLWIALGYLLLPFDLIPDFIPGIGHIDDLILIPALVYLAIKLIPDDVIRECRNRITA